MAYAVSMIWWTNLIATFISHLKLVQNYRLLLVLHSHRNTWHIATF